MTAYYPSQGSQYVPAAQPVVYTTSSHGHGYQPAQYASSSAYYGQPANGNVLVVPTQGSHHSHHSHHGYAHSPQIITAAGAPVVMQPSYSGGYAGGHHYRLSFGERIRRFFGLAPRGPFKYRNNKGTWGFMGYSRRQRYSDARTGAEVDRKGRPIYRV
ncbi:hypothetical protein D9615_000348 [Tricholomella constricta]|uniref:Uncharacterized protein n=1 Tax=Tricholomella constricta TaxID=117010 RepID=A0A8H5HQP6_9AGAR|nr:hypothetical protein D9615_000348 [Tricholomella constricta]